MSIMRMVLVERALTFGGVSVVREGSLGGWVDGLLVDGLGRAFDPHVDRRVGCAGLDDRGRGGGDRRDEDGEGSQSGEEHRE